MLVYHTQRPRKSMEEETGHGGRVRLFKITAMVLVYGKGPFHLKMTGTLWTKIHEWCLRKSKRLKSIDPQMKIQIRNHKFLTQIQGELEHAVKCRCNQSCTLDDVANTLQDVRKRKNLGKYSQLRSSSFKEKQPFRVEFKDKPK
ncbi:hypothetical protein O181_064076 [Austropuccinia psidii MF-1]|uniref:Uncharacterized protein n=1 Tax=Austropuccinia psidii MF-1 TaxID=1389203 RepID=A0A9Q3ESZ8_9BASI|nr:hypothetical protein [Austropuccinia psidii MF-1]